MRRNNADLAVAGGIALLGCTIVAAHVPAPMLVISGIGLFCTPGYLWSEFLLGLRATASERVAVGACIALMVPIFGGLVLHAAGISLGPAAWVGLFTVVTSLGIVALAARRRGVESPTAGVQAERARLSALRRRLLGFHALTFSAAAIIAMGAVALAVVSAEAQKFPGYTQLWLSPLKNDGSRANLGVTNEQGSTVKYRIVLLRKGHVSATWNLTAASGQTWQRTIAYTTDYSVAVNLYRLPDLSSPYREVNNGQ